MNAHICPTCGKLHIATAAEAPFGICGACGEALPTPTQPAHQCSLIGVAPGAAGSPHITITIEDIDL